MIFIDQFLFQTILKKKPKTIFQFFRPNATLWPIPLSATDIVADFVGIYLPKS